MSMNNKKKYYKCYSKPLSKFLLHKGITYIVVAIEPTNNKLYSLYECDDQLSKALTEYGQLNK